MQVAPTHALPVYLFELQNDKTAIDVGSDFHAAAGEAVPRRRNAADTREFSGGATKPVRESGMAQRTTLAHGDTSDRYG